MVASNPPQPLDAQVRLIVAQFDDIRLEAWIERAAIMEYDAGLSREEAERRALLDVLATYGWPHPTDGP